MGKFLYYTATAAMVALALGSCSESEVPVTDEVTEARTLHFFVSGLEVTRALIDSDSKEMTDLWVFDSGTMVAHQVSTDEGFGEVDLTLSYGQHDLSFVASRSTDQSLDGDTLRCSAVRPTFGMASTWTIDSETTANQGVRLNRLTGQLVVQVDDELPAWAASMETTFGRGAALCVTTFGSVAPMVTATNGMSAYVGQTGYTVRYNVLCPSYAVEYTTSVTVRVKDASGAVLSERTAASVPIVSNRQTTVHGTFFDYSGAFTASLNTEWQTGVSIEL